MLALDVRFAIGGPAPEPSAELARVLTTGFSTDNGDLLATAASNVHGPAPQVAGLPKWRKDPHMSTGFLAALVAKLGAIPTAAKAAVATATALTTMTVAGAAANSLPSFAQGPVASAINAVTPLNLPTGDDGLDRRQRVGGHPCRHRRRQRQRPRGRAGAARPCPTSAACRPSPACPTSAACRPFPACPSSPACPTSAACPASRVSRTSAACPACPPSRPASPT